MSHIARMTMIGLYNYDKDLFHDLVFPSGVNKETFINSLLLEYGERPILYTDIDFFKSAISIWSSKWYDSISRMVNALTADYNPIHNYDRHEEYTDNENRNLNSSNNSNTNTKDNIRENSDSSTTTNDSTESKVSAYDSNTYQPDTQQKTRNDVNAELSNHLTSDNNTSVNGSANEAETRNLTHSAHLYGNIGVTKSQEMVQDEIDLRKKSNLYKIICEIFASEMLLYIY